MKNQILKVSLSLLTVLLLNCTLSVEALGQCSFTIDAPDVYYCGNSMVTLNVTASTTSVAFRWALSHIDGEPDEFLSTPHDEVNGIDYTTTNGGASLNIDNLTSGHTVWVRGLKAGCSVWEEVAVVYAPANANAGADQLVCLGAGAVTLTGASPGGGTWSGSGVTGGNTFTPTASFIASPVTLTYNYTNSYGCSDTDQRVVTVEGMGDLAQLEVCKTTGAVMLDNFAGVATGSWSGSNVVGNAYLPYIAPTLGTAYFNYTTLAHGCTGTISQVIHTYNHTAAAGPTISDPSDDYRCGTGVVDLQVTGFTTGNYRWYDNNYSPVFQPNGQLYTSNSYTTPSLSSTKTYYVQGIDGADCGTQMVQVTATIASNPPNPTMINGNNCSDGKAVISVSSPNANYDYEWTDVNGNAITAHSGSGIDFGFTNGGATLTIQDIPGTSDFGVMTRAVNSQYPECHSGYTSASAVYRTLPTVNAGADQTVCLSAGAVTLTGASPTGGTWTGSGVSGNTFTTNSSFIPSPPTLTYSYTNSFGCKNSDTRVVTVEGLANQVQLEVCKTTGAVMLNNFSGVATGSWSGNNVISNAYLPFVAPEFGTVYFNYTTLAHGCTGTISQVVHTFNHTAASGPAISNPSDDYHCGAGVVDLQVTGFTTGKYRWYEDYYHPVFQNGQLFTSNSLSTPSLSSTKTYFVQGIDGADCGTQMVEVVAKIISKPANPTMINGSNCSDGKAIISVSSPNVNYDYHWTDVNGNAIDAHSGEGIDFTFINSGASLSIQDIPGTSDFGVRVTASNFDSSINAHCYSGETSAYAIYRTPPTALIGTNVPFETCTSRPLFNLTGATPAGAGGQWKVNNVTATSFDPHSLGAGDHNVKFTYTDQYGCSDDDSRTVTVHALTQPPAETFRTVHNTPANLQPANPGANKTFNWYTANSGGSSFATADSWATGNVTTALTYYISLKDELITECESEGRGAVTVYPNYLPVVDVGVDRDLVVPQRSTTLNATYSDPDGTISLLHWQKISGPAITLGDDDLPTLALTALPVGDYVFRLSVYDNYSYEGHDDIAVTVSYPPNNYNYVITETVKIKGVTNSLAVGDLDEGEKVKVVQYVDELGRPSQQIQWRSSPDHSDVVQPITYDQFSREAVKYLPYVSGSNGELKEDPLGAGSYAGSPHYQFYNPQSSTTLAQDANPYARTEFEPSPLNRILEQGSPGASWQPETGRTIVKEYLLNAENEILNFIYNPATSGISLAAAPPDPDAFYDENTLTVTKTIDEEQSEVLEFVDKEGRTVCKKVKASSGVYASTYYIYDDLGNLVVVLPPEAVERITDN